MNLIILKYLKLHFSVFFFLLLAFMKFILESRLNLIWIEKSHNLKKACEKTLCPKAVSCFSYVEDY